MSHGIMQFQSTGAEVSKVESDIAQTLSLADTIVTLVREPVALLYQNINKSKAIKRSIGKWEKEAFDANKECHIPVVRLPEVEEFLIKHDGILQPEGEILAKGCWAYFLHSLGIRPRMSVVDATLRSQEAKTRRVAVFHLESWPGKPTNGQLQAHFQPDSVKEIQSPEHPFGSVGKLIESNTLLASYFNALEIGVSHPSLSLPEPTTPLLERITKLLDCIALLHHGKTQGQLLITYEWLESAAWIKKRALAGGGKDRSFYDDICNDLDHYTQLWEDLKGSMEDEIRKCFLFDEDPVDFWIRERCRMPLAQPQEVVIETLEKYKGEPLGKLGNMISTRTSLGTEIYLDEKLWVL